MLKNRVSYWLRKVGFLQAVDKLHFMLNRTLSRNRNAAFLKAHPKTRVPPSYMLYEAYRIDYAAYINDGSATAGEIAESFSRHTELRGKRLLDWGCGPARVVRHLPLLLPQTEIFGADYNTETINWCSQNISEVIFKLNSLHPPLPFADSFFDGVYALSVFTHLSEKNHVGWMDEIFRVLNPGGIFLFSTQGNAFLDKLTETEKVLFNSGEVVVRDKVDEGHRTYSAFQPVSFMQNLLADKWQVLQFAPGHVRHWGPEQDTWILKKIS